MFKRVATRVCGDQDLQTRLLLGVVACHLGELCNGAVPLRTVFSPVLAGDPMPAFTDLRARTNAGEDVSFDVFTGKVVLVVNVARL